MRKTLCAAGAAMMLFSAQGSAATPENYVVQTTGDLVKLCSVNEGHDLYRSARGFCLGFLEGAWEYHQALTAGASFTALACPGPDVTRDQAADVFVAWAEKNPQALNREKPVHGVMRAIIDKWPCPKQ